jgi:DNA-binding IclR family transcriptional regulator
MNVNSSVKSAGRALDVLEAFAAGRKPLTLNQLANAIGAPVSSCHGLVRTLQGRGYLYEAGRRSLYPTKRLLDIGRTIVAHDPVLERLGPVLEGLRDATGETVILGKRQGGRVVYLEVVEGLHTVRYTAAPGEHKPLHSSAIGKALLGSLGGAERAALIATLDLAPITADTITSADALEANLARGRIRGAFATRSENVTDVMALAVPVVVNGETLGVAVAGPLPRMEAAAGDHVRHLAAAARTVGDGEAP